MSREALLLTLLGGLVTLGVTWGGRWVWMREKRRVARMKAEAAKTPDPHDDKVAEDLDRFLDENKPE